ncbi:MAG: CHAT domain-containing protein [Proteobacteria bacterium]|nr:CHAT domain-containing protein [Pseudomonadota bacterium]
MRLKLVTLCLGLGLLLGAGIDDAVSAGQQAWERGDLAEALVHWSVGLDAARRANDASQQVDLSIRLAAVHRDLGRLGTAADLLDQATPLAVGPSEQGRVQTARGLLALRTGAPRDAAKRFGEAFKLHQQAEDPTGAADAALNLGIARRALGQTEDAEKALEAARGLYTTIQHDQGLADCLTNLGALQREAGRLRDAEDSLKRAIALFTELGNAQGEADAMTNLALVYTDLARPNDARRLYESALSTARARKDVRRQATLLLNLGTLDASAAKPSDAAARFRAAQEAFTALGAERDALSAALALASIEPTVDAYATVRERAADIGDLRAEAVATLNQAAMLTSADPTQARKLSVRATELASRIGLSSLVWRARTLTGQLELERGRSKQGIAALELAIAELERSRLGLDTDDSTRFVLTHRTPYEAVIEALLSENETVRAMAYAERLQRTETGSATLDGDAATAARELDQERSYVEKALASELASGGEESERSAALRARLAALHVDFADAVDHLRATHPDFSAATQVDPEELQALQSTLPEGVVVVQPLPLEDRLVLLVLSRTHLEAVNVEVAGTEVERQVGRLARSLRAEMTQDPEWTEQMADKLGAWFLAPIASHLDGADTVVVSASGALRQLPFALLRHEGKYLIERSAVASVTHIGSLQSHDALASRFQVDGRKLGLLGNPDGTLPGAEAEVSAIATRFPGSEVVIGAASTERFHALAAGKHTLHLATHGVINPTTPTQSYLVMGPDEERLSYRMIPGLAPTLGDVRLVVLSACESGLPVKARSADEQGLVISINGLAAQFRRAGVETLVASLWRVDDAGTRALMTAFYDELGSGQDIAQSMRRAQLALLADPKTAHPWYWAGFSVVGDWRR